MHTQSKWITLRLLKSLHHTSGQTPNGGENHLSLPTLHTAIANVFCTEVHLHSCSLTSYTWVASKWPRRKKSGDFVRGPTSGQHSQSQHHNVGTGGTGHCTEIALHGTVEQERLRAALYISLIRGLWGETYHIIESLLIDQRERRPLVGCWN